MNKFPAIALTIIAILFPEPSAAHTFTGRVERLIDGDTIIVRVDCASRTSTNATNRARPLACSSLQRVRLAEIDAQEMKQPYGPEAKKALSDMILHRTVVVQWKRRGRYRRIIGQVYLGTVWINGDLVERGWARHFLRYSRSQALAEAEAEARRSVRGFWKQLSPSPCKRTLDLASSK